jgi:hypothetical protein
VIEPNPRVTAIRCARKAYNAYVFRLSLTANPYDRLPDMVRRGWEAAAQAAIAEHERLTAEAAP